MAPATLQHNVLQPPPEFGAVISTCSWSLATELGRPLAEAAIQIAGVAQGSGRRRLRPTLTNCRKTVAPLVAQSLASNGYSHILAARYCQRAKTSLPRVAALSRRRTRSPTSCRYESDRHLQVRPIYAGSAHRDRAKSATASVKVITVRVDRFRPRPAAEGGSACGRRC